MFDFNATPDIPKHLQKYITQQDYSLYTYEDQAVWRFALRQLHAYLKDHAHPCYAKGLKKTGIDVERIPKVSEMDAKLQAFGWRAVPVSGFIPPAAFMSFQAHRILPIACEMRSMNHILYTPAPDIVHEAAGHAPILVDPRFTNYLTTYGEVATKAIISSEDMALYEAIRELSDTKENPNSTDQDIKEKEQRLQQMVQALSYTSEAQLLGRMNWWTAEYGLSGSLEDPKIYGAGLLSSLGEARTCLKTPKHIPFDLKCLDFTYDITEPQPQLFVVESFDDLTHALNDFKKEMAFTQGRKTGLSKALRAQTPCTVVTAQEHTYSGVVKSFECHSEGQLAQLAFSGPCLKDSCELLDSPTFKFEKPTTVTSVYGGPSDFDKFPDYQDFKAKKLTKKPIEHPKTEALLQKIRTFREQSALSSLDPLVKTYFEQTPEHWLCGLELYELSHSPKLKTHLLNLEKNTETHKCIKLGFELADSNFYK